MSVLTLRRPQGPLAIGVLLTDLDRTLTDERLRAVPSALRAVDAVRSAGLKCVLVTGRTRRELVRRRALDGRFDGYVVESGALWGPTLRDLLPVDRDPAAKTQLVEWLTERRVDVEEGDASLSVSTSDEATLRTHPSLARSFTVHRNRDRLDVVPRGVDKGRGVERLAERLRLRGDRLAFGDAENDLPLFSVAQHRVAVANAAPALKRHADETTDEYGGRGVAAYLRARLLPLVEAR